MPLDNTTAPLTPLMQPGDTSRILFPVVERPMSWVNKDGNYHAHKEHKALMRSYNGEPHVLNVVKSTYKLVNNRELFTTIEQTLKDTVPSAKLDGVKIRDSAAHYGRTCFREYVFPGIVCDIGAKSPVGFRIVVSNAYGGAAIRMLGGAIEFFCTNGLVTGSYETTYARHTSGLVIDQFGLKIKAALSRFVKDAETWKRWVETPVKHEAAMELFKNLAGTTPSLQHDLTEQYLQEQDVRGANLWSVYSAMTYYSSHNEGNFKTRGEGDATTGAAATMFKRELDVRSWINSDIFRKLEVCQ